MNRNISTGSLARPFAHLLAPLTRSLAPNFSLRSRAPLRSFIRLFAHFTHSFACGTVNDDMAIYFVRFFILGHSAKEAEKEVISDFYSFEGVTGGEAGIFKRKPMKAKK